MIRLLLAGTFLAGLALPAHAPAAPSKNPSTIQAAVTTINHDAIVDFGGCGFLQVPAMGTIMAAYSEIDPSGNTQLAQFWTVSVSRELAITVQGGSARASQSTGPSNMATYAASNNHSIIKGFNRKDGTVVHYAYAAWGGAGSCSLRVNGVQIPTTVPTNAFATFLYLDNFISGASVQTGFADAGAAQSWSHSGTGYLFAFLAPETGVAQIGGPNGEHLTDDSTGLTDPEFDPATGRMNDSVALGVAKQTSGAWTYSVSSANETWGPVLWLISLP